MTSKRRFVRVLLASALLVPALVAGASRSDAGGRAPTAGIVSDDGRTYAVAATEALASGSSSFAGTGVASATKASAKEMRRIHSAKPAGGRTLPKVVLGFDGRTQVTDTIVFPATATVDILFQQVLGSSDFYGCTGFFVGPDTVVTAGHCVHKGSGGRNGFYPRASFELRPALNGSTVPFKCPDGSVVEATRLWTNTGWANTGAETVDYAAIHTSCPIGETVGWYGYSNTVSLPTLKGIAIDTRGYPGDKPSGTQWLSNDCKASAIAVFHQCTVATSTAKQVFYKNDTFGGQSGSPVYRANGPSVGGCSGTCAYAIHAYATHGSAPHNTNNHGTRIENSVTGFINLVRNGGLTG